MASPFTFSQAPISCRGLSTYSGNSPSAVGPQPKSKLPPLATTSAKVCIIQVPDFIGIFLVCPQPLARVRQVSQGSFNWVFGMLNSGVR
jgi:hypothetical protein